MCACHRQLPSSRHSPCRTGLQARSSSPGIAETRLETRSPFPPFHLHSNRGLRSLTSFANGSETLRLKPQLLFHDARTLQSGFGFSRMCACHGQPPSSRHSPCRTGLEARSSSAGIAETGLETRSPFPPSTATPTRGLRSLRNSSVLSRFCAHLRERSEPARICVPMNQHRLAQIYRMSTDQAIPLLDWPSKFCTTSPKEHAPFPLSSLSDEPVPL